MSLATWRSRGLPNYRLRGVHDEQHRVTVLFTFEYIKIMQGLLSVYCLRGMLERFVQISGPRSSVQQLYHSSPSKLTAYERYWTVRGTCLGPRFHSPHFDWGTSGFKTQTPECVLTDIGSAVYFRPKSFRIRKNTHKKNTLGLTHTADRFSDIFVVVVFLFCSVLYFLFLFFFAKSKVKEVIKVMWILRQVWKAPSSAPVLSVFFWELASHPNG